MEAHLNFDWIVFDLDGTLWDTTPACAVAWNNVLRSAGIAFREIVVDDVRRVTGLPHDECIRRTFATLTDAEIEHLVEATSHEDNRVIAEHGGELYAGVAEGLAQLSSRYKLAIVSNCQSGYVETFYALSGLGAHFTDFECFGNTGRPKGENLKSVLSRNSIQRPLMIGDAAGDETAARFCNVPFAFVTYGFGVATAPDHRFDSFDELTTRLLAR